MQPRLYLDRQTMRRIFSKMEISRNSFYKNTPCWEWQGGKVDGYGAFRDKQRPHNTQRAHRLVYQLFVEILPSVQQVTDHLCRNRACINPCHIEIVDHQTNLLRGNTLASANASKTHCKDGHPFSGDNLVIKSANKGHARPYRSCRICRNLQARKDYRRKKG